MRDKEKKLKDRLAKQRSRDLKKLKIAHREKEKLRKAKYRRRLKEASMATKGRLQSIGIAINCNFAIAICNCIHLKNCN